MRKREKQEVAQNQELANKRLQQSQLDLLRVQSTRPVIMELVERVRQLNKENNFATKMEAAYRGQQ